MYYIWQPKQNGPGPGPWGIGGDGLQVHISQGQGGGVQGHIGVCIFLDWDTGERVGIGGLGCLSSCCSHRREAWPVSHQSLKQALVEVCQSSI